MSTGSLVLGGVLIAGALALWAVAGLLRLDRIAPNGWVGLRIRATAASDAAWYAGQRATVPFLRLASALIMAGGVATISLGDTRGSWPAAASCALALVSMIGAVAAGRRAAKEAAGTPASGPKAS